MTQSPIQGTKSVRRRRRFTRCRPIIWVLPLFLHAACTKTDDGGSGGNDLGVDFNVDDGSGDSGPSGGIADGVCTPDLELGDPCPDNDDAACLGDLRCLDETCQPLSVDGGPCTSSSDCQDGLYCQRYDNESGELGERVCRPEIGVGNPCSAENSFPCESPLRCIRGTCQEESSIGGPCESNFQCDGSDVYCDQTDTASDDRPGVCREELGEGAGCVESNDGCESGLDCIDGTCEQRRTSGEPCESGSNCAVDHYCDRYNDDGTQRAQRICLPEVPLGEPCEVDELSNCDSGNCVAGVCVDDQGLGQPCDSSSDCLDHLYCDETR